MASYSFIANVRRTLVCAALVCCAARGGYCWAQDEETLPPAAEEQGEIREQYCPPIKHLPLSALSIDISPLDADGEPITQEDLPQGCLPETANEAVPFMISYGPECWNCHDILQLARFCHPRIYFEDVMLERYGVEPVFPCLHSTSKFACDLFFLPAHLVVNKRHPCVRTPTPHCWSGCRVCGF